MIDVGFEIGTGRTVKVPADRHIAITGQTQLSGKTTTLEALVDRSEVTAVAFVTKRGEGRFQYGRQIQPYFRTPLDAQTRDVDWQFVESVLGSTLNEKMKSDSLRLAIIRATGRAKTLQRVHENVTELLEKAKGQQIGVYTLLDAYFRKVIPELETSNYSDKLELHHGLNVMDISTCSESVQQLVVRSVAQTVIEKRKNIRLIVPEAWKFIPENANSPSKQAIITFIRVGAGIGNLLWIDSQDLVGVSKEVLRAMGVWFIGAQQEYNEVTRILKTAVVPTKLEAHEIKTLSIGQFYVLYDTHRFKTYIQPLWADAHSSAMYAAGKSKMPVMPAGPRREDTVTEMLNDLRNNPKAFPLDHPQSGHREEHENKAHTPQGEETSGSGGKITTTADSSVRNRDNTAGSYRSEMQAPQRDNGMPDEDYEEIRARLLKDAEVIRALAILQQDPDIKLQVKRIELPLDAGTIEGTIGLLIKDGWFGNAFTRRNSDVQREAQSRGVEAAKVPANVTRALGKFMKWGFLVKNSESRYGLTRPVRVTVEEV